MKTVALILPIRISLATIVNVALNDMRGNLGATINEIAWVVTAYSVNIAFLYGRVLMDRFIVSDLCTICDNLC
jgi:hypothetical protein